MTTYPSNSPIETTCTVKQTWRIESPQISGAMHCITSEIIGLPSHRARTYAADMAAKVRDLLDWGSGP